MPIKDNSIGTKNMFSPAAKQVNDFKNDLANLISKYEFGLQESPDYYSDSDFACNDYHFEIDGKVWYGDNLNTIITDAAEQSLKDRKLVISKS